MAKKPTGGTTVKPTTPGGGRKLSPEHRARIAETNRARYAAMSPAEREATLARIGRRPRVAQAGGDPSPPASREKIVSVREEWPGPLPDAAGPGAGRGSAAEAQAARPNLNGHGPAPIFAVPDLPPMELGEASPVDQTELGAPAGLLVSQAQVTGLVRLPFRVIAVRRGRHWRLNDEEAEIIAEPLTRKVNESAVLARGVSLLGDWLVIVVGLTVLVSARVLEDEQRAKRDHADGEPAGAGVAPGPVSPGDDHRDRGGPDRPDASGAPGAGRINRLTWPTGASPNGNAPAAGPAAEESAPVQALRW